MSGAEKVQEDEERRAHLARIIAVARAREARVIVECADDDSLIDSLRDLDVWAIQPASWEPP